MEKISCVLDAAAITGESPVWDEKRARLYWVDIPGQKIHRFDPATGTDEVWPTPEPVGALGLRERGGLVLALKSGFYFFDLASGKASPVALIDEPDSNRLNDGRVDPAGRFWAGSMNERGRGKIAALYCLNHDLTCEKKIGGIALSNTLCWSPDGRVMYHADTLERKISAWDFDAATGAIGNQRLFIDVPPGEGVPDGATVDAEAYLWVAHWGTGHLNRYNPSGKLVRTIQLPVTNITCPAFGGAGLDILYVTSATAALNAAQRAAQPQAGGLFAIEAGVRGLPEKRARM